MSRRLAADISWLWVGYAGRSLAYLALTIILTRSLGPADFGELSLFMAFGLGVSSLAGSWPFLAVPILTHRGRAVSEVFPQAARLAAAGTLACLVVALPIAWQVLAPSAAVLAFLAVYSVALVSFQGLYGVFQAQGRMKAIAGVQTSERSLALIVIVVISVALGLTVRSAEATLALAAIATSALAYLLLVDRATLRAGDGGVRSEGALHWRTVLKTIGAMGIVNAASYGVAWIDIYLLAALKSNADVGVYSLAYQIYTFVLQLASLWIVATLPRHARSFHAGVAPRDQLPQRSMTMGVRLWASLVGIGAVIAGIVLTTVFGDGFADSLQPLVVLLIGASMLAPYLAVVSVLIAADESPLIARVSIACVSVNLIADLALIPVIGVAGPAVATTAQTVVGAVWLLVHTIGGPRAREIVVANAPVVIALTALALDPTSPLLLALTGVVSVVTSVPALRWVRNGGLHFSGSSAEAPLAP